MIRPPMRWRTGITRKAALASALAAVLAAAAPAEADACPRAGAEPGQISPKQARTAIVCLINQRRGNHGIGALGQDRRLVRAAQRHSNAMDAVNFFSHSSPNGSTPQSRIQRAGYMSGASAWGIAENIRWGREGRGSPKAAVASWMASSSHRAALLSASYRELGVGVAIGSPTGGGERNTAIYTANFGYRR